MMIQNKNKKILDNGMARDYFQRENLKKKLKMLDDEDLILISDVDEIPNLENLNFSKSKKKFNF